MITYVINKATRGMIMPYMEDRTCDVSNIENTDVAIYMKLDYLLAASRCGSTEELADALIMKGYSPNGQIIEAYCTTSNGKPDYFIEINMAFVVSTEIIKVDFNDNIKKSRRRAAWLTTKEWLKFGASVVFIVSAFYFLTH